jgi:hypothetical protein
MSASVRSYRLRCNSMFADRTRAEGLFIVLNALICCVGVLNLTVAHESVNYSRELWPAFGKSAEAERACSHR